MKHEPLAVSVNVHLDTAVLDSGSDLLLGGARATVEDEEDGAVIVALELVLDESLVLGKELRVKLDVARLVDTVDIAEGSSDGEHGRDGREGAVDVPNVLGLSVERVVVNRLVVDTVLLTTGDTNLHLEPEVDL